MKFFDGRCRECDRGCCVHTDTHAFLLLPKAQFLIKDMDLYTYVVDGNKVPPFSSYMTGDAEKNSIGFKGNKKKLSPPLLKECMIKNQERAKGSNTPAGGTGECGFT